MRQANIGWIGLLPLLALWLGMNRLETERVEFELAAAADSALAQVVGEPGFSIASGRDVSLNGWIFDEATRPAALAAAAAAPGIRNLTDGLSAPPLQNPFLWRAAFDGAVATLSGSTPSPEARAALVAAAQADWPQARIVDQMSYFSGASPDFVAKAAGGLQILAHLTDGTAQLRGSDLNLSGKAASSAEYQAAQALAHRQELGGGRVKLDVRPPEAVAYAFQAESDGKVLSLSGSVASETERAALLAQAKKLFPELAPADKLQVISGAPTKFAVNSALALRALAQLKSGKVSMLDNVATLSGQARPGLDAASIAAPGAAQGVIFNVHAVTPGDVAPYILSAEKSEAALILTGFYPSDEIHEKILASAREKFSGLTLIDQMQYGAGAPKAFLTAALAGLDQLARLRTGKFGLRDRAASLRGDAVKAETAEEIKTGFIGAMPDGFPVETDLTGAAREAPPAPAPAAVPAPPPPAPLRPAEKSPAPAPQAPSAQAPSAPASASLDARNCRDKMMDLVRASPIQFAFHSAQIERSSYAVLDALSETAKKCPAASIEVAGHTVDFRRKSYNRNLSRRRAEAVAAYLAEAGVDATRLTATGYGDSMPVAPNDTDEGQAKNRRIEFNLK